MTDPSRRDGWGQEHPGTYNYPAYPGSTYGQQAPYPAAVAGSRHAPTHRAAAGVLAVRIRPVRDGAVRTAEPPAGHHPSRRSRAAPTRGAGCGCWRAGAAVVLGTGHRPGHRQQLAAGHRRRAAPDADRTDARPDRRRPRATPTTTRTTAHHDPRRRPRRDRRRPTRRTRATRTPSSTPSPARAGRSASSTSTAAACCRPSSTSCCRGARKFSSPGRPTVPRASASSTSAANSPARSPSTAPRPSRTPGPGLTLCTALGSSLARTAAAPARTRIATSPSARTVTSPPSPARSVPKTSMNVENSNGARNDAARPVVV